MTIVLRTEQHDAGGMPSTMEVTLFEVRLLELYLAIQAAAIAKNRESVLLPLDLFRQLVADRLMEEFSWSKWDLRTHWTIDANEVAEAENARTHEWLEGVHAVERQFLERYPNCECGKPATHAGPITVCRNDGTRGGIGTEVGSYTVGRCDECLDRVFSAEEQPQS